MGKKKSTSKYTYADVGVGVVIVYKGERPIAYIEREADRRFAVHTYSSDAPGGKGNRFSTANSKTAAINVVIGTFS